MHGRGSFKELKIFQFFFPLFAGKNVPWREWRIGVAPADASKLEDHCSSIKNLSSFLSFVARSAFERLQIELCLN